MKKLISVILSIGLIASVALAQGNKRDPRTPEQIAVDAKVMERYPRPEIAVPGVIWGVIRILEEKHRWTEQEIRGFLGENAMRVYKANWQPQK